MKCTAHWTGCKAEAVYELRQYKDIKNPNVNKTYYIGSNCEQHVPKSNAHQYIINRQKENK